MDKIIINQKHKYHTILSLNYNLSSFMQYLLLEIFNIFNKINTFIRILVFSCLVIFLLIACNKNYGSIVSTNLKNNNNFSSIDSLVKSISKDTLALAHYLNLAKTSGDFYAEMMIYEKTGQYYMTNQNFSKAIENHENYLEAAFTFNDTIHIIKALIVLSTDYNQISAYSESAKNYFKALNLLKQLPANDVYNADLYKAQILTGLGTIYLNLNEPGEALKYFKEALQLNLKNNNIEGQAENKQLIGHAYENMINYDSAYIYYSKSLEYYINSNSISGLSACFNRIGNLYLIKGEYEAASVYLESAYNTLQNTSDIKNWLEACLSLGNLKTKTGNYSAAKGFLYEGLTVSKKHNFSDYLERVYLLLSELHKLEGKSSLALEERIKSDQYAESFRGENNINRIMQFRLNYEKEVYEEEKSVLAEQHKIREEIKQKSINVSLIIIISLIAIVIVLIQNQKLRIKRNEAVYQLEKDKTDFCLNVSQEFKTPVTIILGILDRLKRNIDQNKEIKNLADLEILSRQSENLQLLIDGVSSIANLEEDKKHNKMVYGNIIAYLQYLYECYSVLAEIKKIDYLFHSNVKELHVDYIPEYLRIIVSSLIGNAMEYCTEKDNITVNINLDNNKRYFTIEVTDTGEGKDFIDIPYLFESRHHIQNGSKKYNSQSGLSITKHLVERINGRIEVKNYTNGKTVFCVRLPISNENIDESENSITIHKSASLSDKYEAVESNADDQNDKPIVLIIEDNRDMSYYLSIILKDKYNVIVESSSDFGISTANNKIPDIIISDVSLPHKGGYNLCEEIRSSDVTSHIPVILLTVNNSKEERVQGIKSGADAFLVKPVYEAELIAVIDRLLSSRRQIKDKYSQIARLNAVGEENDSDNEADIDFLNRVTNLIYRDITNTENIIELIASDVCISSSQLNRKIKALTGMTTTNFVLKTRLNRAKKLLTVTQKPIGDVAMECGFNDFAYFSRSFKKEFGMTPTTFQRLPHSVN